MLQLRSFQDCDSEAVRALHDEALEEAGVRGGHGPWEADLDDVRVAYLEPGGDFVVGHERGELVAMGGLMARSGRECEIRRMRVRPDRQRRGFGRQVLEALEQRARALGFERVVLDTTEEQAAARRFYECAGYRETGRREGGRFVFIDFAKEL